ncbi:MAG TPA: exodeoxyribonuclease VII large subunit [Candidatus Butyricicoccus stercorigallinarum]|nr:exodeoxyribonuclease VII large subunit [Candidatus Butyricicoccus stercorigallinarum]
MKQVFTVSQVNHAIKLMLEEHEPFRNLYVQGEISNYKAHSSGHRYLTLKDKDSVLSAVLFRSDAARLRFRPENGMKVIARGRLSCYPKYGQYQLYIADMMPDGIGALTVAFEQLKQRLYAEGLFDEARKKPLPRFPQTIALVTSPTGAAVRDVLRILRRRYPLAAVQLYPVLVQGEGAAADIAQAIAAINRDGRADVIIAGRGGGSLEDLWAFNEEIVARAIAASEIPVISAVGHEPDVTIADFAADVRASTPSHAAELCVPDAAELRRALWTASGALRGNMETILQHRRAQLDALEKRRTLRTPVGYIQDKRFELAHVSGQMTAAIQQILAVKRQTFVRQAAYLDAYSPLKVLARGYSVVTKDGAVIASSAKLRREDTVLIRFAKGGAVCRVEQVKRKLPASMEQTAAGPDTHN